FGIFVDYPIATNTKGQFCCPQQALILCFDRTALRVRRSWNRNISEGFAMADHKIVDSSFTSIINAPIEKIDLPTWAFALPDKEYQGCSPAHVAAGFTTAPDGTRMSINVEVIGGSLMVQHYL